VDLFVNLHALESNPSLVRIFGNSASSWSEHLEEATKPGRGALVNLLGFAL